MSNIQVGSPPPSTPSLGATGGSNTPSMPWNPSGNTPSVNINWNLPPAALLNEIEQQFQSLMTYLNANPSNAYNGGLALLQLTLQIGQNMSKLGPDQSEMIAFLNNQMTQGGGDTTLMSMIVMMAAQGEAVQNGQTDADAWIAQLATELKGMTGLGSVFSSMYMTASYYSAGGLNSWINQYYVTPPNPVGGSGNTKVWINPLTGLPYTNFNDFANALAMPVGNLLASASATQYINSLYQTEIAQIFAGTTNPWERMMELLALVSNRMNDQGQQMNGLSGNLNTLSEANTDVSDMQNDLKTPTAASMQDFYKRFANLNSLIDENPSLASLAPDLSAVEGIFNGNTVSLPSTNIIAAQGSTPGTNFNFTYAGQTVVFTPSGGGSPVYLQYDGKNINAYSQPPSGQKPMWSASGSQYTSSMGSGKTGMGNGTGTITTALSWSMSAGNYTLPENVEVAFTSNGTTTYMIWNGTQIETSSAPNMSGATNIPCSNGQVFLPAGTMTVDPVYNSGITTLTYGQLQGLGDYQDIATAVNTAQSSYANTTASNNANVLSSLQTYFNSIAQPTQQEYQTDSSSYSTEMSAFAQFLQAPITQETTFTTAAASANS